jgi:hypothetical protein
MKKLSFLIGLLSPLFINQAYAETHPLDFSSNNWSLIEPLKQQTAQEISKLTSRANKGKSFNLNIELLE